MRACAHPDCYFRVTKREFGGFCCKRCHAAFVTGGEPTHGPKCEKMPGRGFARAKPTAPHEPNAEAVSKNAMKAARRREWTEEESREWWNEEPRRKAMRPDPAAGSDTISRSWPAEATFTARTPRAANPPKTQALD